MERYSVGHYKEWMQEKFDSHTAPQMMIEIGEGKDEAKQISNVIEAANLLGFRYEIAAKQTYYWSCRDEESECVSTRITIFFVK
jgi:hypothetical protein